MIKVLIIRFSSIGDIIWTHPLLRCLKNKFKENIQIHYLTKTQYRSLLEANPHVHKIHLLEEYKNLIQLAKNLKQEKFDYVLDLHNKINSILIKVLLFRKTFTVNKNSLGRYIFVKLKIKYFLNTSHFVDKFINTAKSLGVCNDNLGIDYFIPSYTTVNDIEHTNYAVYIMGASTCNKKLTFTKAIELCQKIHTKIILIGGIGEIEMAEKLQKQFPDKVKNMVGVLNINQSALVIKNANIVVGHDTGLTQLAAAFHNKIYSLWGSTTPLFGVYPYCKESITIQNKKLNCRPCSKAGLNYCPKKHFKCIKELELNL